MPQTSGLRALLITTDYPPDIGGLQTYAWRIVRDLPGGLLAQVVVGSDHPAASLPRPAIGVGFRVHRGRTRARAFLWSFASILSLRAGRRINLQLHMQWSTAFASLLLGKFGRPSPYIILIHGVEFLDPGRPWLNRFKKAIFAGADAVVAGSAYTAALFTETGLRARRLEVIPYGNPLEGRIPAAPAHKPEHGEGASGNLRLLCMHRLVARKGTSLLIAALAGLRDLPWTLDIVGRGEEEPALRKQLRDVALEERVRFHPPLDEEKKISLLARADLFILPSLPPRLENGPGGNNHVEGLGLTLLESQSLGTPVLAARTGGIPEAVADGVTGRLFQAGDLADLRAALAALLKAPGTLREMGGAGPEWVAGRFNWKSSLARLADLMAETAVR